MLNINTSVIMPCYNSANTVIESLESILNQSYKYFEIIIIDDGSIDNTNSIISNYILNLDIIERKKIKMFKQKNKGVSAARNLGISKAKGKYITFLDADDVYHEKFLEELINNIEKFNVDTCYCCYSRKRSYLFENKKIKRKAVYLDNYNLLKNFMYRVGPCVFANFLYKRSIIQENNILFNEELRYAEDIDFIWRYLISCKNGMFINSILYWYRDNEFSVMNNISWDITQTIDVVNDIEKQLELNNNSFFSCYRSYMHDRAIWAILKEFSLNREKILFKKLIKNYNVKKSMRSMLFKGDNILIKLSSFLYLLNKNIFYMFVRKY